MGNAGLLIFLFETWRKSECNFNAIATATGTTTHYVETIKRRIKYDTKISQHQTTL